MSKYFDDFILVKECIAGEEVAWNCFVTRFSRLVSHSITKTLKSDLRDFTQDVADLHNSIFLSMIEKSCKKLRQFEGKNGCSLASWVRLISTRHTLDFIKKQRVLISLDEKDDNEMIPLIDRVSDPSGSIEEELISEETKSILRNAINELPVSDQFFMKLYYEKELSPDKIAKIMHVSINTIYSKKSRIQVKLEKLLSSKG